MGNYCQSCSDTKKLGFVGAPTFTFTREFRGERLSDRILATGDVGGLICTLADKEGLEATGSGTVFHLEELSITWQWRGDAWHAWRGSFIYHIEGLDSIDGSFTEEETAAMRVVLDDGALPNGNDADTLKHIWISGGNDGGTGGVIIAVVSDCSGD